MKTDPTTLLECGYCADLEIAVGYALAYPTNCAIRERTADGDSVGPCTFYLKDGMTCPRHGQVKFRPVWED